MRMYIGDGERNSRGCETPSALSSGLACLALSNDFATSGVCRAPNPTTHGTFSEPCLVINLMQQKAEAVSVKPGSSEKKFARGLPKTCPQYSDRRSGRVLLQEPMHQPLAGGLLQS